MHYKRPSFRHFRRIDWFLLVLLICVFLLSSWTCFHTSLNLLDSDTSSEMVLANHLYETGGVLSDDWCYSTELRVLNTQLVFAPLFGIFDVWRRVRFVGTMFLQVLLVASYGYLIKHTRYGWRVFLLGSSLLLLPISVTYGRIVLNQAYYIPHLSIGFATVGSFLACMQDAKHSAPRLWKAIHIFLFLALSFGGALGGIRQPAATQLPLMLISILVFCNAKTHETKRSSILMLALATCGCLAAGAGMVVNDHWHQFYSFASSGGHRVNVLSAELLSEFIFAFLHQFGFRRSVFVSTSLGLLSLASVVAAFYLVYAGIQTMKQKEPPESIDECVCQYMFPFSLIVGLCLVFFVLQESTGCARHLLPFCIWFIPYLCIKVTQLDSKVLLEKTLIFFTCILCFVNGIANQEYFIDPESSLQPYEGLIWSEPTTVKKMTPLRDYLTAAGYDIGYSTLWQGNILTEMSDGQLRFISLVIDDSSSTLHYVDWLTLRSNRLLEAKRPFVLLTEQEVSTLGQDHVNQRFSLVANFDSINLYEPIDLESWKQELIETN